MLKNIFYKSGLFIVSITMFLIMANSVYALPLKPPVPGRNSLPGVPQEPNPNSTNLPPQPNLPPCTNCGTGNPTPTIGFSPTPTVDLTITVSPTVTVEQNAQQGTSAPSSSTSSEAGRGGPQVLGLSDTGSDLQDTLSFWIGLLMVLSGLRMVFGKEDAR